ncbi:MAG: hypothetical protein RLN89_05090 [Parvibaculum sp.]
MVWGATLSELEHAAARYAPATVEAGVSSGTLEKLMNRFPDDDGGPAILEESDADK